MTSSDPYTRTAATVSLTSTLRLLGFGLALLALLIAIDRPQWFVLRPASGTAAALSKASEPAAPGRHASRPDQGD